MKRYVALDTETTGQLDAEGTPGDQRIIEIGCVEIIDREITGRTLQFYVNPERPVDEGAFEVHGISDAFLSDKPKFAEIADEFIDFIRGATLLIHNAKFDVSFMDMEFGRLNLKENTEDLCEITDTLLMAMEYFPAQQVNLDHLCELCEVDNSNRTIHGALLDAQLLAEVYLKMTGGQVALDLGDRGPDRSHWQRPPGVKLRLIQTSKRQHAEHIGKMVEMAQSHEIEPSGENTPAIGGVGFNPEIRLELLKKNEDETKKDFKARLNAQKEEVIKAMLGDEGYKIYQTIRGEYKAYWADWDKRMHRDE